MITTRLYQCFHDHGSIPKDKYISDIRKPLLCGASLKQRNTSDINIKGLLKDNVGPYSISHENTQFSELTGYYWIWNTENTDIVGIEHYRRHFIKHDAVIDNDVKEEDLITDSDILPILQKYDFILPVPESLANTSIYDLYVICFGEEHCKDIIKWINIYYKDKPNYLDAIYNYMSHNKLYRANMLITIRREFNDYCRALFDFLFFLRKNMTVKEDSRVWGYISELFPMIYVTANNKSFYEVDMAVDDFNQDLQKDVVYTTQNKKEEDFSQKDPDKQIEFFKSL